MRILLIGCQHGDEKFGKKIISLFSKKAYKNVSFILANEKAAKRNVRYIDQDLNRSFPGDQEGNYEQRRAYELLPFIQAADIVLDIHTTTSDVKMVPIVASLNPTIERIINLTTAKEIVVMGDEAVQRSLIGHAGMGISLEFGLEYSQTHDAIEDIRNIIEGLISETKKDKIARRVFYVSGKIFNDRVLPRESKNFEPLESDGIFPFLLHEKAYKDFQGFYADRVLTKLI
jgi:succinylglutamate desuccinylase